jgi:hypothetical protein
VNNSIVFILLIILGVLLNHKRLNELPAGVHAWSQADKYAIAARFLEGRNILDAATFSLQTPDGKVGCEFPLIPYLAAKTTLIIGQKDLLPFVYRMITWLFFSLGVFALFKILINFFYVKRVMSAFFVILICFSPLLLFYGFNFQIDISAFGLVLFSLYYFISFLKYRSGFSFAISVLFVSIASAIKLSAMIYFVPILISGMLCLFYSKNKNLRTPILLSFLYASIFMAAWYYYNSELYVNFNKVNYNFVFLTGPQNLERISDVRTLIYAFQKWKFEYFNALQWIFISITLIAGFVFAFRFRSIQNLFVKNKLPKLGFTFGFLFCALGFVVLMGKQFSDHDYYIITPFLPAFFLIIVFAFAHLYKIIFAKSIFQILMFVLASNTLFFSLNQSNARMADEYKFNSHSISNHISWAKSGDKNLANMGIEEDAAILVLYAYSSNIHLVHFNRKGLIITEEELSRSTPFLEKWLHLIRPKYILFENEFEHKFWEQKPYLKPYLLSIPNTESYKVYSVNDSLFEIEAIKNYQF